MTKLSIVTKKSLKIFIILILLASGISFFLITNKVDFLHFILGIVLGGLLAMLKIVSTEKIVTKIYSLEKEKVKLIFALNYIFRFCITFLVLIITLKVSKYLCFGIIITQLLIQPSILLYNYFENKKKNREIIK